MSKRTRDILILTVLAIVLIAAVLLLTSNSADVTGGLRDVINR